MNSKIITTTTDTLSFERKKKVKRKIENPMKIIIKMYILKIVVVGCCYILFNLMRV